MGYRRVQIAFFVPILRLGDSLPTVPTTNDNDNDTTYWNTLDLRALAAVSESVHVQSSTSTTNIPTTPSLSTSFGKIYCHQKEYNELYSTFHLVL